MTVYRCLVTEQDITLSQGRLDRFLTAIVEGAYSRSFIHAALERGAVTVNGVVVLKPSRKVVLGDAIVFTPPAPVPYSVGPLDIPLEIIDEQEDFIVINKPSGLLTHHVATAPSEPSVVHALLHKYPAFSAFESLERPGIIHRLDRDTSGILLIARTPEAQTRLAALFKDRTITKEYRALVVGHPPRTGIMSDPIGRHPTQRHKMGINGIAARSAITHYAVSEYYDDYSELSLKIETGRTHQIRVHCASIGHPVLGDGVYGKKDSRIDRQALHAYRISFTYRGVAYEYTAPLPADFLFLTKLKS